MISAESIEKAKEILYGSTSEQGHSTIIDLVGLERRISGALDVAKGLSNEDEAKYRAGEHILKIIKGIEKGEYPGSHLIVPFQFRDSGILKASFDLFPRKITMETIKDKKGNIKRVPRYYRWEAIMQEWVEE